MHLDCWFLHNLSFTLGFLTGGKKNDVSVITSVDCADSLKIKHIIKAASVKTDRNIVINDGIIKGTAHPKN